MKNGVVLIIIILLSSFLPSANALAQVIIKGEVRDAVSGQPAEDINVILQTADGKGILKYCLTKADGRYEFSYTGDKDSLAVTITGFNIVSQTKAVAAQTQNIDFFAESTVLQIREVQVKSPKLYRKSDTLTYNVAGFADEADRSIGDVIRKMPGIEVSRSGEISYQGKPINKFYIEDLDMLQGRYGIATNNVQAGDIASVQVYENHQPIRALRDLAPSDAAALNLKLKESARGAWNATLQLGGGYKPWMWDAEAVIMYFARHFQTINTYKTNNSGNDAGRELTSFYDRVDAASSLLGVHSPSAPSLDKDRYLRNNIHAVSINTINKLGDNLNLTANAHYIHDIQVSEGSSVTTYYIPETSPLVISEQTYASQQTDKVEASLLFMSNTDKHYLSEKFTFSGLWNNDAGGVRTGDDLIKQSFRLPCVTVKNDFRDVLRAGRFAVTVSSVTDYNSQPASLFVVPMIYADYLEFPVDHPNALQTLDSRRLRSYNSAFTSFTFKGWTVRINAGLNAQLEWMESQLTASDSGRRVLPPPDSLQNDTYWRRLDLSIGPGVSYNKGDRFSLSFNVPVNFTSLHMDDKVRDDTRKLDKATLRPSAAVQGRIAYDLRYSVRATYSENYGGLYDSYGGLIMTDYRTVSRKKGDVSHTRQQNYNGSLSYANALSGLFGSLEANYWYSWRNLTYGTTYQGSLSHIESYAIPAASHGYRLNAGMSKLISAIATTLHLSAGYSRTWNDVIRQDVMIETIIDRINASAGFNTRFGKIAALNYRADYSRNKSKVGNNPGLGPIDILRQDAELNFTVAKKVICRVAGEFYHNSGVKGEARNMFFLDAGLSYRSPRAEYSLEGRNLLGTDMYGSAGYSDNLSYVYTYTLRPASIMFKIKFSLK